MVTDIAWQRTAGIEFSTFLMAKRRMRNQPQTHHLRWRWTFSSIACCLLAGCQMFPSRDKSAGGRQTWPTLVAFIGATSATGCALEVERHMDQQDIKLDD